MRKITVQQLYERIEQKEELQIIDIREAHELQSGTVPGIVHHPMYNLVYHHEELLSKDTEYYIVCEHGVRSVNLITYLLQFGYQLINVEFGTEMYSRFYPLEQFKGE